MTFLSLLVLALLSFLISFLITKRLITYLGEKGIFDIPNQRSSHLRPVPRGGGIAIITAFLISIIATKLVFPTVLLPGFCFFLSVLLLMAVGFVDDKLNISPVVRFLIHILAVGLVVFETDGFKSFPLPEPFDFPLGWAAIPLTFFWVLAVMNIYNFLDGIDGFAGAQAFIAGISFAILDFEGIGSVVGIAIAFSALGFLIFNWHPAKIFMGDVGSVTLGFIFATLPLYLSFSEKFIGNFAAIIFLWFFLSDGTFTILHRVIQRKKVWEAHREHLYQKWIIKGKKHSQVVVEVMSYASFLIIIFFLFYFEKYNLLLFSFILALILFLVYLYRVKLYK